MTRQSDYPESVKEGFTSFKAAKATIKSLFEDKCSLEKTVKMLQDELENWRAKYHESDKKNEVMGVYLSTNILSEIFKFLISTILAGLGINFLSSGKYLLGGVLISSALIIYTIVTITSNRKKTR